ncbi:hypothetical protein BHM03_00002621 [Ensete ventricosum]|nr:hypothetical protein BHM03_00002621 [Ensete ventricosum]
MARGYDASHDIDGTCSGGRTGASFGCLHLGCRRGRQASADRRFAIRKEDPEHRLSRVPAPWTRVAA